MVNDFVYSKIAKTSGVSPSVFYNFVLYRRRIKRLALTILASPIAKSFPYQFFYQRKIKKIMKRYERIPQRVMIENTNICNADCVFCPHKSMKRAKGIMSLAFSEKITDECARLGIDYLTIYGFGEPLLDKYFFERICYAKQKGILRVTTNTNAMYLDKQAVRSILDSGLDEIYISFDAATEKTYRLIRSGLDFKTVEENILFLLGERKKKSLNKPKVILSFVESGENSSEVEDYLSKWKDKVDYISISLIHNWTGQVEDGNRKQIGFRDPCRLLWTDMVVSWDGKVPLCCNDYENRIIIGDYTNESIPEIWGGEKLRKIRNFHLRKDFSEVPICANCTYNFHHKSPWWVSK